jgi:hypothetical protein
MGAFSESRIEVDPRIDSDSRCRPQRWHDLSSQSRFARRSQERLALSGFRERNLRHGSRRAAGNLRRAFSSEFLMRQLSRFSARRTKKMML